MKRLVLFIIAVLMMSGCAVEVDSKPSKPAAKPKLKTYSAYDVSFREKVEKEIEEEMHSIAAGNPGKLDNLIAHCAADTQRNFTCTSSLRLSYDDGMGGSLCGEIVGEQRGTVDPKTGDYDWRTTNTDNKELEVC